MTRFVVFVVLTMLATGGIVAAGIHRLRVHNRVVMAKRGTAPLHWLTSPRLAPRLHRRLRASMAAARLAMASGPQGSDGLGLADIVHELEARAVELDAQLVIAAHAPEGTRRRMLRELQAETTEIERLVERVLRMRRAWNGGSPSERGLGEVRDRLELLETALRELDGLELPRSLSSSVPPVAHNSTMDELKGGRGRLRRRRDEALED